MRLAVSDPKKDMSNLGSIARSHQGRRFLLLPDFGNPRYGVVSLYFLLLRLEPMTGPEIIKASPEIHIPAICSNILIKYKTVST